MIVIVDYDRSGWFYYYYDKDNFRTKTEGFKNHILANNHAVKLLGDHIEVVYK